MRTEYVLTSPEGETIASVGVKPLQNRSLVHRLWVHPDYRGLGLSRRLLGRVTDDADKAGVVLESHPWGLQDVNDEKTDRTLYSGLGIVPTAPRTAIESLHASFGFAPVESGEGFHRWMRQPGDSIPMEPSEDDARLAAVQPIKPHLPFADLMGLTPEESSFQRTHPVIRQNILNRLRGGDWEKWARLDQIHQAQLKVDRVRARQGRPSPYAHPSRPQPYGNPAQNPAGTTMVMPRVSAWNGEDEPSDAELDDLFAESDRLGNEHDEYHKVHGVPHPDDLSDLPAGEAITKRYDRTPDGLVEHHWEDDLLPPHEAAARERPTWANRMQEPNLFSEFGSVKVPGLLPEHTIHYHPTGEGAACGAHNPEGSSNNVTHVTCNKCRFTRAYKMAPTEQNPNGKTWDQVEREDRAAAKRRTGALGSDEARLKFESLGWHESYPGSGEFLREDPQTGTHHSATGYGGDWYLTSSAPHGWHARLSSAPVVWYHGTPDERTWQQGAGGIHIGTYAAAKQALEARIGRPAEGEWDGTREYGSTPLVSTGTGLGAGIPEGEPIPPGHIHKYRGNVASYSDGTPVPMDARPSIFPVRVTGPMTNTPSSAHDDFRANGYMRAQLARGRARSGYYYTNVGEDAGSVSAVVPSAAHLKRLDRQQHQASANVGEADLKAAGIAVIAMDTGRVLMQQRALNPLTCPCGMGVTWDEQNGYQHDDGSVSHDGEFYGQTVSDLLDQGHPIEKEAMPRNDSWLRGLEYSYGERPSMHGGLHHAIDAFDGDDWVGHIVWNHDNGVIQHIETLPDYEGNGLATELLNRARVEHADRPDEVPSPKHDWDNLSPAAERWIEAIGEMPHDEESPETGIDKSAALEYDPNEGTWEFPGGKLDPGESARAAALREFREEVGQDLPPGVFVGAWVSPGAIVVTAAGHAHQPRGETPLELMPVEGESPLQAMDRLGQIDTSGWSHGFRKALYRLYQTHSINLPSEDPRWGEEHPQLVANRQAIAPKQRPKYPDRSGVVPLIERVRRGDDITKDWLSPHVGNAADPIVDGADPRAMQSNMQYGIDGVCSVPGRGGPQDEYGQTPDGQAMVPRVASDLPQREPLPEPPVEHQLGLMASGWKPRGAEQGFSDPDFTMRSPATGIEHQVSWSPRDQKWMYDATVPHYDETSTHGKRVINPGHPGRTMYGQGPIPLADSAEVDKARRQFDRAYFMGSPYGEQGIAQQFNDRSTFADRWGDDEEEPRPDRPDYTPDVSAVTQRSEPAFERRREGDPVRGQHPQPDVRYRNFSIPKPGEPWVEGMHDMRLLDEPAHQNPFWGNKLSAVGGPVYPEDPYERIKSQSDLDARVGDINRITDHMVSRGWTPETRSLAPIYDGDNEYHLPKVHFEKRGPDHNTTVAFGYEDIGDNDEPYGWGWHITTGKKGNVQGDSFIDPIADSDRLRNAHLAELDGLNYSGQRDSDYTRSEESYGGNAYRNRDSGGSYISPDLTAHGILPDNRELFQRLNATKAPVYKCFIYLIQNERDIDLTQREHANPDDPDGDMTEQSAWWDIEHAKKNPALRAEVKKGTPWAELELWADKSVRSNKEIKEALNKLGMEAAVSDVYDRALDGDERDLPREPKLPSPEDRVRQGDPGKGESWWVYERKQANVGDQYDNSYNIMDWSRPDTVRPTRSSDSTTIHRGVVWPFRITGVTPWGKRIHLLDGSDNPNTHPDIERESPRDQWPMRLCLEHSEGLRSDIKNGHFNEIAGVPLTDVQAEHDTWPIGAGHDVEHRKQFPGQHELCDVCNDIGIKSYVPDEWTREAAVKLAMPRDDDYLGSLEYHFYDSDPVTPGAHKITAVGPDGEPHGSVRWWKDNQRDYAGEVNAVWVHPAHRRKGLAYELFRRAKDITTDRGWAPMRHDPEPLPDGEELIRAIGDEPGGYVLQHEASLQKQAITWDAAGQHEDGCITYQMRLMNQDDPVQAYMTDHTGHGGRIRWRVTRDGITQEQGKARRPYWADQDVLDAYGRVVDHPPMAKTTAVDERPPLPEGLRYQDASENPWSIQSDDDEETKFWRFRDPELVPPFDEVNPQGYTLGDNESHHRSVDWQPMMMVKPQSVFGPDRDFDNAHHSTELTNVKWDEPICEHCYLRYGSTIPMGSHTFAVKKYEEDLGEPRHEFKPMHPDVDEKGHLKQGAKAPKCSYCKATATKQIKHSEGMGLISVCDKHLAKGKADAENCTPDGTRDPSNIDWIHDASVRVSMPTTQDVPRVNQVIRSGEVDDDDEDFGEGARVHDVSLPSGDWIAKSPQYRHMTDPAYSVDPDDMDYWRQRANEDATTEEFASRFGRAISDPEEESIVPEVVRGQKAGDPLATYYVRKYPDFEDLSDHWDDEDIHSLDHFVNTPRGKIIGLHHAVMGEGDHVDSHNMGLTGSFKDPGQQVQVSIDHTHSSLGPYADAMRDGDPESQRLRWYAQFGHSPYAGHFLGTDSSGNPARKRSNPLAPGDADRVHAALETMRPWARSQGVEHWVDAAQKRTKMLGRYASGTETMFPYQMPHEEESMEHTASVGSEWWRVVV